MYSLCIRLDLSFKMVLCNGGEGGGVHDLGGKITLEDNPISLVPAEEGMGSSPSKGRAGCSRDVCWVGSGVGPLLDGAGQGAHACRRAALRAGAAAATPHTWQQANNACSCGASEGCGRGRVRVRARGAHDHSVMAHGCWADADLDHRPTSRRQGARW